MTVTAPPPKRLLPPLPPRLAERALAATDSPVEALILAAHIYRRILDEHEDED